MPDPDPQNAAPATPSPGELCEIVRAFADSDLRELRLTVGGLELLVSRNEHVDVANGARLSPPVPPSSAASAVPPTETSDHQQQPAGGTSVATAGHPVLAPDGAAAVRAPVIGVFYRRAAPDQRPYVEVGAQISVGDPVGIIEVMKMFTTVNADVAGTVTEICVADAVLVEYDQVLMYISPAI